jgi:hypothetical protein
MLSIPISTEKKAMGAGGYNNIVKHLGSGLPHGQLHRDAVLGLGPSLVRPRRLAKHMCPPMYPISTPPPPRPSK